MSHGRLPRREFIAALSATAVAAALPRTPLVASELLEQEAVIGFVIVEGANDVIAVTPGIVAVRVVLETIGLGKADNVEPVLAPVLPIVRIGEQALDQILPGVRGAVGDERRNLGGRRRQTHKVEADTADEGCAIRRRRRLKTFFFQTSENEGVERRYGPILICRLAEFWNCGMCARTKGPMAAFQRRVSSEWGQGFGRESCRAHRHGEHGHKSAKLHKPSRLILPRKLWMSHRHRAAMENDPGLIAKE